MRNIDKTQCYFVADEAHKEFGLVEVHPATGFTLRTYRLHNRKQGGLRKILEEHYASLHAAVYRLDAMYGFAYVRRRMPPAEFARIIRRYASSMKLIRS